MGLKSLLANKRVWTILAILATVGAMIWVSFQWGQTDAEKGQQTEQKETAEKKAEDAAVIEKERQKASDQRERIGARHEQRKQAIEKADNLADPVDDTLYRILYGQPENLHDQ